MFACNLITHSVHTHGTITSNVIQMTLRVTGEVNQCQFKLTAHYLRSMRFYWYDTTRRNAIHGVNYAMLSIIILLYYTGCILMRFVSVLQQVFYFASKVLSNINKENRHEVGSVGLGAPQHNYFLLHIQQTYKFT